MIYVLIALLNNKSRFKMLFSRFFFNRDAFTDTSSNVHNHLLLYVSSVIYDTLFELITGLHLHVSLNKRSEVPDVFSCTWNRFSSIRKEIQIWLFGIFKKIENKYWILNLPLSKTGRIPCVSHWLLSLCCVNLFISSTKEDYTTITYSHNYQVIPTEDDG